MISAMGSSFPSSVYVAFCRILEAESMKQEEIRKFKVACDD
jgi:hypothetical protein